MHPRRALPHLVVTLVSLAALQCPPFPAPFQLRPLPYWASWVVVQGLLAAVEACLLVGFGYAFGFRLVSTTVPLPRCCRCCRRRSSAAALLARMVCPAWLLQARSSPLLLRPPRLAPPPPCLPPVHRQRVWPLLPATPAGLPCHDLLQLLCVGLPGQGGFVVPLAHASQGSPARLACTAGERTRGGATRGEVTSCMVPNIPAAPRPHCCLVLFAGICCRARRFHAFRGGLGHPDRLRLWVPLQVRRQGCSSCGCCSGCRRRLLCRRRMLPLLLRLLGTHSLAGIPGSNPGMRCQRRGYPCCPARSPCAAPPTAPPPSFCFPSCPGPCCPRAWATWLTQARVRKKQQGGWAVARLPEWQRKGGWCPVSGLPPSRPTCAWPHCRAQPGHPLGRPSCVLPARRGAAPGHGAGGQLLAAQLRGPAGPDVLDPGGAGKQAARGSIKGSVRLEGGSWAAAAGRQEERSGSGRGIGRRGSHSAATNLCACILVWLQAVGFMALAIYLDAVLPDANGVRQPPWFFLLPSYWRHGGAVGGGRGAGRQAGRQAGREGGV